jgi:Na+/melibiose symporter-like transporter
VDAGLTELILAAVISGGVVSVILTFVLRFLFDRRLTTVSEEIKSQFEQQAVVYRSNREWRERSVAELLGPVHMQLDRSRRAFARWEQRNDFLEGKVV